MANKIIKYTLTGSGKIRSYISHGGSFLKANSNASPQDWDMVGATVDGSNATGLGEFENKTALKEYLDTFTSEWVDYDADGNEIAFDTDAAATLYWNERKID